MNLAEKLEIYNFKVFSYGSMNYSAWDKYVGSSYILFRMICITIEDHISGDN